MEERRKGLIYGIKYCSGHSEGNLHHLLLRYSPLRVRFPNHCLEYRYCKQTDKAAAKKAESCMIKAYVREFGEAPPLNSAIPDRYGSWNLEPVGE